MALPESSPIVPDSTSAGARKKEARKKQARNGKRSGGEKEGRKKAADAAKDKLQDEEEF